MAPFAARPVLEMRLDWENAWARSAGAETVSISEVYKGYNIRAFESSPGKWKAEIQRVDGASIRILLPNLKNDGLRASLTTEPETITAEAAVALAKQAIDGRGMN